LERQCQRREEPYTSTEDGAARKDRKKSSVFKEKEEPRERGNKAEHS
jgi:hypothetical protein